MKINKNVLSMKQFILSVLLLCVGVYLQAQDEDVYFVNEDPTVTMGITADDFEGVGYNNVKNDSEVNRNLTWTTRVIDAAEGWTDAVCDKNLCYLESVETADFTALPDETCRLDVHVYPNGNEGFSIVEVEITEADNPNFSIKHEYYFNTMPSASTRAQLLSSIKVYPNPAQDYFTIEEGQQAEVVEVLTIDGKMMRSFLYNDNAQYMISDLAAGHYVIRLTDQNGQAFAAGRIAKQ
jgi:hypothetical protein